jgi:hypothetical protein
LGAFRRATFVPVLFSRLVAIDTMFGHHLFFNQFSLFFEALDAA